jgi:hypothetical protein
VPADLVEHVGSCDTEPLKRELPFTFETGPGWSPGLRFLPDSSSTVDQAPP